ncbi:MAG: hypothetical protein HYW65_00230 [Candidatus Liptonbacteria bacterium]|nr:hypothetical protein [Candidatus Liptonbacteria bacterium]
MKTQKILPVRARKQYRRIGAVQQKILLLLLGGFSLGLTQSPRKQWKIIGEIRKQWEDINTQTAERAIASLYESKMVEKKEHEDGTVTMVLSERGRKRALTYHAHTIKILRPNSWDKKWRIVIFDIPETARDARDSLREHLTRLGFHELQKSVSVFPFECRDEIEFLIELHEMRPHVRFIVADSIDNELHLKRVFNLD